MNFKKNRCRHGLFSWADGDDPIGKSLEHYGEWAEIEINLCTTFINKDSYVIDIGANIGTHTVAFARLTDKGKVYSFEPNNISWKLLQENIKNNGLEKKVELFNSALGEKKKKQKYISTYEHLDRFNSGAAQILNNSSENKHSQKVNVLSLDDVEIERADFIKIDVEGMELDVLSGASKIIKRDLPIIYCEASDSHLASNISVFEFLGEFGYTAYFCATPAYNLANYYSNEHNFFGVACESSVLYLPDPLLTEKYPGTVELKLVESDLDLARFIIETPRYGDKTDYDRDPGKIWSQLEGLKLEKQKIKEEKDLLSKNNAGLIDEIRSLGQQAQLLNSIYIDNRQKLEKTHYKYIEKKEALSASQAANDKLALELQVLTDKYEESQKELTLSQTTTINLKEKHTEQKKAFNELSQVLFETKADKSMLISANNLLRKYQIRLKGSNSITSKFAEYFRADVISKWKSEVRQSGYFDDVYYCEENPDVARSGIDPIEHFLYWGVYEGRQPNNWFSPRKYLSLYPDVRDDGINPLVHYIHFGQHEGRIPVKGFNVTKNKKGEPIYVPSMFDFASLKKGIDKKKTSVDVIIPVYLGYEDTLACIFSVLTSSNKTPFEIVVINDCSPDKELGKALENIEKMGFITLLKNKENKGFVGTVNIGMSLHETRDVVLLNSDTMVYGNWLDRIIKHSLSEEIGTITPFSNNATIFSYPHTNQDNNESLEIPSKNLDEICAEVNQGESIEVPTGVGFCMYVSRKSLCAVGDFDEESFGKGYGEENDFCMRLSKAGFKNIAALDVFVRHTGAISFAASSKEKIIRAIKKVNELHPGYNSIVRSFIACDPFKLYRRRIDANRLSRIIGPRKRHLCVTHNWGGGIAKYIADRQQYDKKVEILELHPSSSVELIASFSSQMLSDIPNLKDINLSDSLDILNFKEILSILDISHIEIHSTVHWPSKVLTFIPKLCAQLGIEYSFFVHDYVPVCPQVTMVNESNLYCGEKGLKQCINCLSQKKETYPNIHGDEYVKDGLFDLVQWRKDYAGLLYGASSVAAPSKNVADRLVSKYFKGLEIDVVPHEDYSFQPKKLLRKKSINATVVNIVIIGAISMEKGAEVLLNCAEEAYKTGRNFHFYIVGYTCFDKKFANFPNVTITGRYEESKVYELLEELEIDLAFFPAVWPETFSYTLTIAFNAGYPIVAFNLGAIGERLKEYDKPYKLLSFEIAQDREVVNNELEKFCKSVCQ